ncbi:16S rRNA (cytidine(1402)-2'-O)-methyltransferase [Thioclava sp. GXIMD4216]|uniref:Ribosomal RNA small subunit methyltransferase I n=1 Tax=Thioclava litoralis TaxID=3076557 RepID=A0ABZ1DVJ7_9RHOB|nr:16S rRNA (cytidine(1402)-2'-O)-methyltransferase [Thioclava sp. FTW29]
MSGNWQAGKTVTVGAKAGQGALAPGLHFIATPIGAARDITLRALDMLATADVLVAEDTRSLRHLMEIHGVALDHRPLISYHDQNGDQARPKVMHHLGEGRSVVYASEAGTPLVADPGYQLGRAAIDAGVPVHTAPGPSAALAALTVSGLPSDRFLFAGFPPRASKAKQDWFRTMDNVAATMIFYESPKRVKDTLADLAAAYGADRQVVICRELTKRFEEALRGSVAELQAQLEDREIKGEIVILVDRAGKREAAPEDIETALRKLLPHMSVKDASAEVAQLLGLKRREVYQIALGLEDL